MRKIGCNKYTPDARKLSVAVMLPHIIPTVSTLKLVATRHFWRFMLVADPHLASALIGSLAVSTTPYIPCLDAPRRHSSLLRVCSESALPGSNLTALWPVFRMPGMRAATMAHVKSF